MFTSNLSGDTVCPAVFTVDCTWFPSGRTGKYGSRISVRPRPLPSKSFQFIIRQSCYHSILWQRCKVTATMLSFCLTFWNIIFGVLQEGIRKETITKTRSGLRTSKCRLKSTQTCNVLLNNLRIRTCHCVYRKYEHFKILVLHNGILKLGFLS
jgi:hypothetical protein